MRPKYFNDSHAICFVFIRFSSTLFFLFLYRIHTFLDCHRNDGFSLLSDNISIYWNKPESTHIHILIDWGTFLKKAGGSFKKWCWIKSTCLFCARKQQKKHHFIKFCYGFVRCASLNWSNILIGDHKLVTHERTRSHTLTHIYRVLFLLLLFLLCYDLNFQIENITMIAQRCYHQIQFSCWNLLPIKAHLNVFPFFWCLTIYKQKTRKRVSKDVQ